MQAVCTIVCMKYKYPTNSRTLSELKDIAIAYHYGSANADRRVQLKMPSMIVDLLDQEFPGEDRSSVLTKLAIDALARKKRFGDSTIPEFLADEQSRLDDLWDYLDSREVKPND